MPGTIKIGNEGFRATLETSGSDNDLILKNVNGQQMLISSNNINFYSGSLVSNNRIKFI